MTGVEETKARGSILMAHSLRLQLGIRNSEVKCAGKTRWPHAEYLPTLASGTKGTKGTGLCDILNGGRGRGSRVLVLVPAALIEVLVLRSYGSDHMLLRSLDLGPTAIAESVFIIVLRSE
jgi:hypothetical protein